jgi:hypothetical protein
VGYVARTGDIRSAYTSSVWETERKKALGRPKSGENVLAKECRNEIWYECVDWFQLTG